MIPEETKHTYYRALLNKDPAYEGIFYVGIKTTGVFCRPTCPARKPKFENCLFFESAKDALFASFRPCKRCAPLSHPNTASPIIQKLVERVEASPEKRWKESDFKDLSTDISTVRRHFKRRFGMTFVAYARARRMGLALDQIRAGEPVIEAQLSAGYESGSGFRDAFSRILGTPPSREPNQVLKAAWLDSPLGPVVAMGDDEALYLLEFVERRGLEREVERLRRRLKTAIIPGTCASIESIKEELEAYFNGSLQTFKTPLFLLGSLFQKQVWGELLKIPYGQTCSYADLACAIGRPTAYRAVAQANGSNQLGIVIPCHRVINTNGELGGYGGGVPRKKWLLEHENRIFLKQKNIVEC